MIRYQPAFQNIYIGILRLYKNVCHKSVNLSIKPEQSENSVKDWIFFPHFCRIMFEGLKKKWKVNGLQLVLILCTFAIGGSATGFVGKKIMNALSVQQDWLWAVIYILLITIIWPLAVLIVSIPFGQFRFFTRYIKKIGAKLGIGKRSNEVK